MILAVNPYQWLSDLYTDQVRRYYAQKLIWDELLPSSSCFSKNKMDPRIGVPPHVYEVSSLGFKGLISGGINQSIVVMGESGSGKTETVKIVMHHIVSMVQQQQQDPITTGGESLLVKRIVDSGLLLEAFGNAKTCRNDNSSRFGKYNILYFALSQKKNDDDDDANYSWPCISLIGSTCEVYLLQKSRVSSSHHDNDNDNETERG
jgi:myosin V